MCPITNFAKGRFSEIQSRVSNSLLELIQTLYFVQLALLLKSAESTVAIEPITPYSIKIFISF